MSFSYNGPASGLKDEVRFLLGDTNPSSPFLSDEEIDWLLAQSEQDPYEAAVAGCDRILITLAGAVDESVGEVSISFSQQLAAFERVYARLRRRSDMSKCGPIVTGITHTAKLAADRDPNRVKPLFSRRDGIVRVDGWADGNVGYPLGIGNVGAAYGDENGNG